MDGTLAMSFPPLLCRDRYPKWLQQLDVVSRFLL